jgi:catechol 2,3-dioxygenase-like lactoylglutathione lyase family enzyme
MLNPEGGTETMTALGSSSLMAFVATRDAGKARAFYEDKLGLRFVADEPVALVFDANGTALRIAKVKALNPAPYTVLGWGVADIIEMVTQLTQNGVTFERFEGFGQDELGIWASPDGTRVCWFKDPDGNVLSLTQFPADPL